VNAIIPPLALDGPCLSIRRFGRDPVTARNMLDNKTMSEPMLELLSAMVKGRLNLLISGEREPARPPYLMCFPGTFRIPTVL